MFDLAGTMQFILTLGSKLTTPAPQNCLADVNHVNALTTAGEETVGNLDEVKCSPIPASSYALIRLAQVFVF